MATWAVLATGPSMSQAVAYQVHGRCSVVAVSDAYRLAPWADTLASNDSAWWRAHPEALQFKGKKFCSVAFEGTERLKPAWPFHTSCNSGLFGMRVAAELGASRILLMGFDMHGSHFFGRHKKPLKNTTPERFQIFMRQFRQWRGCEVINCTPGSALTQFPMMDLQEALCESR